MFGGRRLAQRGKGTGEGDATAELQVTLDKRALLLRLVVADLEFAKRARDKVVQGVKVNIADALERLHDSVAVLQTKNVEERALGSLSDK